MTSFKQRLQNGELALGIMVSEVRNPNVAYMLAQAGFDFFIVDNEHGSYSAETVANMIAVARGAGLPVIVRIAEVGRESILKPLDAGAAGLLVPMVDTPEQAAQVVEYAKYPPQGVRGAALRRAHSLYARVDAAAYLEQANRDTFIAVQVETQLGIANVEAIARVEGVDCVFVGPFDLSVSLGFPGQLNRPEQIAASDQVVRACQSQGKISGTLMFDAAMLREWIEKGMRFVVYSSDISLLADAAGKAVADLKSIVG
jgi:2-keto-3-deoxy-L-rhamnonate aldolase RhmA